MEKVICPVCKKYVNYTEEEVLIIEEIKGIEVEVMGSEAHCAECGDEVYVGEVEDRNIDLINKKYRELTGLIQVEEINDILKKYSIGKKPLSMLLGWGDNTIIRYTDGSMPTKQYSNVLKELLDNPMVMMELLEKGKSSNDITDVAYNKSMRAVEQAMVATKPIESNIEKAVAFFLSKSDEITHLTLQKLLYNSQGWSIALTDNFMFIEDCQAWVHGPVYKDIYNKYSSYGSNPIPQVSTTNLCLSDNERYILEGVWKAYGGFTGKQLEKMSHSEMPWVKTREGLRPDQGSDRIITKDYIKEYFGKVKERYEIVNAEFINDYSFILAQRVGI
jgi:putative zinc finger/helix-turn-helix YgiT family protein